MRHLLLLSAALALSLAGCVGDNSESGADGGGPAGVGAGGKADVTVGPIVSMRCRPDQTFVRRGGVVRMEVDAPDAAGDQSRNYELTVEPAFSARVVQRSRVIFDQDGVYTIVCKSLDSALEDRTAVSVGEQAPALAVNAPGVLTGDRLLLVGRATSFDGGPTAVSVDGTDVAVDTDGSFQVDLPLGSGLERHDVIATDSTGDTSLRRVWAMGGPYGDLNAVPADVVRLDVAVAAYPEIARLVEGRVRSLMADDTEFREAVFGPHEGSAAGWDWRFEGSDIGFGTVSVELKPHADGLIVHARLEGLFITGQLFTNGLFGDSWAQEAIRADIDWLELDARLKVQGLQSAGAEDVEVTLGDLEIDLADSWRITENILERMLQGKIPTLMGEGIEAQTGELVTALAQGLERTFDVDLPAVVPAPRVLQAEMKLSGMFADQRGLHMGLHFGFDGETDPLRLSTPGPFAEAASTAPLPGTGSYEVAVDQSVLNNLMFAIWQTGQMDLEFIVPADALGSDQPLAPQMGEIDVFVTPQMPPVVQMIAADTLLLTVGDVRVDGILESELGAANISLAVGAQVEVKIAAGDGTLQIQAMTSDVTVDVLVPPMGMEREGTRRWGARLVELEVMPKIAELLTSFEFPVSDLSDKGLGVNQMRLGAANIPTGGASGAIVVSGDLIFE
jgi:hypothetical protein